MNLHIENQKLRFRIKKEELEKLCLGEELKQEIFLPKKNSLNINIKTTQKADILFLLFSENSLSLLVNKKAAQNLFNSLPKRDGLKIDQEINGKQTLNLILEVDIRTQKRKH